MSTTETAVKPEDRGLKDSGVRQNFAGGAVRDTTSGKGRYDLIGTAGINLLSDAVLEEPITPDEDLADLWESARYNMGELFADSDFALEHAMNALRDIAAYIQIKFWKENNITPTEMQQRLVPTHAVFRVARVYEKGAQKYAARNWEKGINLARFLDSAQRHWYQVLEGKEDEDHAGQALWNVVGWVQTRQWIDSDILPKSFDDMPVYKEIVEETKVQ